MEPITTSGYSNVNIDELCKDILERKFNYHVQPPPKLEGSEFQADYVQFDKNNEVDVLVELRGWTKIKKEHFDEIYKKLSVLISQYNPRILIFFVAEFISDTLISDLRKAFASIVKREDFEFITFDRVDIENSLREFPDLRKKYFDPKPPPPKISLNEIKTKILTNKNINYYLVQKPYSVESKVTSEILDDNFGFPDYFFLQDFKPGDLILEYLKEDHKVENLFEMVFESLEKINEPLKLRKLYKFKEETRWKELRSNSMLSAFLDEFYDMEGDAIQKLSYEDFKAILNVTELGPIEVANKGPQIINNVIKSTTLNNDGPFAKVDLLGFENDIRSFATMMALRETNPPLAIALFGNWGTGKSFFMHKLEEKITYLSKYQGFPEKEVSIEQEIDTKEEPFCKGVAQISFNAWSYMDANLMASLVSEVFEKLYEYIEEFNASDEAKEKIKEELSNKLGLAKEQQLLIEAKKLENKNAIRDIESKLETAKNDVTSKTNTIKESTYEKVMDEVKMKFNFSAKINLIIDDNILNKEDLKDLEPQGVINQLKSTRVFINQILQLTKGDGKWIWLGVFFLLIALFLMPYIFIHFQIDIKIPQIILFIVSPLPIILRRIKATVSTLSPILAKAIKIKEDYENEIKVATSEFEQKEKAAQIEIQQKENEIYSLNEQHIELEKTISNLEFSLKNTISQRALYSFITERSKSEDYSRHLGIISTIRKDFETLSDLFNDSKSETQSFRDHFKKPLERIILYIDDLDRCPDEKVMEVLQAVHLLMAFPLFIVVVGVDKRCVYNALNYKNLMQYSKYTESKHPEDLEHFGIKIIQPYEYLEKIFQIPFHLKEANDDEVKNMINNLLKDQIDLPKTDVEVEQAVGEKVTGKPELELRPDIEISKAGTTGLPGEKMSRAKEEEIIKATIEKIKHIKPEDLKISKDEMLYLQEISWLVGHAPRTIKRFINMYRIIRAHEELSYSEEEKNNDFLTIIFILGLAIGCHKKYANDVFDGFTKNNKFHLSSFLNSNKELSDIKDRLEKSENINAILSFQNEQFNKFIPFVRRFSFGSENHVKNEDEKKIESNKK